MTLGIFNIDSWRYVIGVKQLPLLVNHLTFYFKTKCNIKMFPNLSGYWANWKQGQLSISPHCSEALEMFSKFFGHRVPFPYFSFPEWKKIY